MAAESMPGMPANILIQLTTERCGSTLLFDALRCHPGIYMHQSAVIQKSLVLGRYGRYPVGLLGGPRCAYEIELSGGQRVKIPNFDSGGISGLTAEPRYAIERIHPHFFGYDSDSFRSNIAVLERQSNVRVVYQVRDPRSAIVSHLRYQERDPKWHGGQTEGKVVEHYRKMYETILDACCLRRGLVVSYDELAASLEQTVVKVFEYLWKPLRMTDSVWSRELLDHIVSMTARDTRKSEQTAFLGERPGSVSGGDSAYDHVFARYESDMDRCYDAYRSLLRLRDSAEESNCSIRMYYGT